MFPEKIVCLKRELFNNMLKIVKCHGFDGWMKWFWLTTLAVKALLLIGQIHFSLSSIGDINLMTGVSATLPVPIMGVIKVSSLHIYHATVDRMFRTVRTQFWDIDSMVISPSVHRSLNLRVLIINFLIRSHILTTHLLCVNFIIFPIPDADSIPDKRPLPLMATFPWDTNPTPVYQIMYGFLVISNFLSVFCNAIFDFTYVYFAQHLAIQLALVKDMLRNLTAVEKYDRLDIVEKCHERGYQDEVFRRMKVIVDHHSLLIEFGRNLEDISAIGLLIQVLMSVFSLVFTSFIILTGSDRVKAFKLLIYLSSLSIQFVIYAVHASDLEEKSESIVEAAYDNEWYLCESRIRSGLAFLQMNAAKRIKITAGWLIEVNHPLIIQIYRTVFSTLTFILEFAVEDKTE